MSETSFSVSVVEDAALVWLEALGYQVLHGPDIAAGDPGAKRSDSNPPRHPAPTTPASGRGNRMTLEQVTLLPVEALREALANAFVHRDYAIGSGSVSVALYNDRLEIISIGDLHFGLTPEALFREHESRPWNPMIARSFYRRGIIETWGRGTLKIARLMREAGHQPPTVSLRPGAVVVTFGLPATGAPENAPETTGKTTGKTTAAVLRLLAEDPNLSVPQLAVRLQKSELTIHRAIRTLRESGRLVRIGPDKGGYWKVIE